MNKVYRSLCLLSLLLTAVYSQAQISTNISGGSSAAGAYTTFAAAITALNGSTITGPVIVDVSAGQTETLTGKITMTATGTATNTITIQRSGVGANPQLISYVGTVATPSVIADGFFVLAGSDYVTIDGLDLQESAANTTTTTVMEFGYGLFKASVTDGCQNNIIMNCSITLNRIQNTAWTAPGHNGSVGIAVLNGLYTATGALTPTSVNGSNSFNKFYSNTIQNCNAGIVFLGFAATTPYTFASGQFGDTGNDVGGTSAGTGNTILNFGGGAATNPATGVFANNQWDLNISYNTINNNNGSGVNHATTLRGIFMNSSSVGASVNCNYNNITVTGGATTSQLSAIESAFGATAAGITNTININNNTVATYYPTATSGSTFAIYHNAGTATNLNMNNNSVSFTSAATSGTNYLLYNTAAVTGTVNINGNTFPLTSYTAATTTATHRSVFLSSSGTASAVSISSNTLNGGVTLNAGAALFYFIYDAVTTASENISNNSITNVTLGNTSTTVFFYLSNATTNVTINNNTVNGITNTASSASQFNGIYNFSTPGSGTLNITNNTFTNITTNRTGATIASSASPMAIFWATLAGPTQNVTGNTISNWTNTGAGYLHGMYVGYGTTNNVYNNTISNLTSSGSVLGILAGNSSTVNMNTYGNNISGLTTNLAAGTAIGIVTGTGTGTTGPSGVHNIYANKVCNITANGATGVATGLQHFRSATSNIYNNLITGIAAPNSTSASAVNGINIAATVADVVRIYYNTVYLTGTSTAANFGSSSLMSTSAPTTAAPPTVDIRNNLFANMTTPTGTGLAVGHRRVGTTLTAFNLASNNNMWYTGTPSATNLIYYDGTNADQTLSAYQLRVTPREGSSFTSDPSTNFLSTTCGNASMLHIDANIPTQLESGAVTITTPAITTDIDGDLRSSTPDVGADEFNGITPAPSLSNLSMIPGVTPQCSATPRDVYVDATTTSGSIALVQINYSFNGVAQSPVILTNIGGDTYYGQIPPATPSGATVTWSVSATSTINLTTSMSGSTYGDDLLSTMIVTASASVNPVCSGSGTVLTASVTYPGGSTKILGAGSTTSSTYSNPFYSLYSNTHNQHLVLASELTALGILPGNITALGINLTDPSTLPMLDFSLKIGSTTSTGLTSFVTTPLNTVYTSASFMPVIGINTMTFSTPFYWDGTSNIVIEICHGNSTSTATMSRVCQVDNTSFVSSIHTHKTVGTAGSAQCSDNATNLLTYTVRPRFYFTVPIATSNFNWNDGTSNIGTSASLTVNPLNTTTYTCSMDALGCSTSALVTVTALPVPSSPAATNSTQCGVAVPTASVSSTAGGSGTGQFFWYNQASNGTLLQGPPMSTSLSSYYLNDFSTTTLTNASIVGNASITGGYLQLTPNLTSQTGGITVNATGSYNPTLVKVEFDQTNSPAGLADGFSYSFSNDGSATSTVPTNAELGTGSKLRVGFDTYGTGAGAAGIYLMYGSNVINSPGQTVGTNGILAYSNNITWVNASNIHVIINVDAAGLCSVTVGGTPIFTNVQLPAGYVTADKSTWTHIIKARTGGIAGSFIIDNLNIQTNQPTAGTPTYLSAIGATTTFYVAEMGTTGCPTLRTPVTVTVVAPPTLAITPNKVICNNYVQELSVTTGSTSYASYIWSPTTNLFTDAAGTIPYTGTSETTVYFRSSTAGSYPITINVSEPVNGCMNTATSTMSVLPASISVSASPASLCVTGNSVISFAPTTNLFTASLQWSSSPDNVTFTPISGATGLTYNGTGLTSSTYYQMTIIDDNNTTCLTNTYYLLVDNPSVTTTTGGSRCGAGTVDLGATPSTGGTINWYANASGGGPIGTGTLFTTPSIASTTTFYAACLGAGSNVYTGGKPGTNGADSYNTTGGIYFTVYQGMTLNTVKMYPGVAGTATIVLYSGSVTTGTPIYTTNYTFTAASTTGIDVPLGWSITPGNYTIFMTASTAQCKRDFSGGTSLPVTAYPYTIGSACTLTDGSLAGYYYFFYNWNVTVGCESARVPVVATINTAPTLSLANSAICAGGSTVLNVSSTNDPNYTYTWMPGNLSGAMQTVNPSVTTTYTVTALDQSNGQYNGCINTGTQLVTVNPNPTLSSATATPASVNPGCNTPVTLAATTSAPSNILVGDAASTLTTSTTAVTPYSSFYESGRIQYLITATELSALGFGAGNISSMGFDVTATSAFNQTGYTIKMGHTSASALSGYATINGSMQTVYGPVLMLPPSVGVNTYNFSSSFNWNGVDNVIIEICHDNDNSGNTCGVCYGTSGTVKYTATTFNSVYGTYNDNSTLCGTGIGTLTATSTTRPNIYLNGIAGQVTDKVWTPGSLVGNSVTVTPTASTIYTVTCTNSVTGCMTSGTVSVTMNPDATLTGLAASYNVTASAVTMTGTPSGGVFSGPGVSGNTFDPSIAGVGTHTISYLPAGYCIPATATVIVLPNNAIVNLKCYIEGFYIGSGMMQPVLNNQGLSNPITDCDDVVVELHDATSPYATAYTFSGVLQTDGTLSCTFPGNAQGSSYYLVVNHRNAMQTWSANPVLIGATTNYDFSTAANKAYGDNQVEVATGVFAFFSGDMNQDLSIDAFDYLLMDPDIYNGAGGWLATDLNGDGSVDAFDYLIYDPNGYNGITVQSP